MKLTIGVDSGKIETHWIGDNRYFDQALTFVAQAGITYLLPSQLDVSCFRCYRCFLEPGELIALVGDDNFFFIEEVHKKDYDSPLQPYLDAIDRLVAEMVESRRANDVVGGSR